MDFFTSIIFEGPMASAIKAETIQTIGSVVLTITPEGKVTCSMLDQVTRENIYLNITMDASIPGEIEKDTDIAFIDASLVKGIISNYSSGDTVFLSLNDDEDMVVFSNLEETMVITEPNIDAASIPGNDKGMMAAIKWEDVTPEIGGKKLNVKFGIHFPSLRVIEKMNKTLDTPHISVKFSGKELYFISGDYNDKRTNLFKASLQGSTAVLDAGGKFVDGPVNASNKYPIGIIPLIKSLDDADGYARVTDDGRLEQLLFVGERNGIKKVYMIGASAKTPV